MKVILSCLLLCLGTICDAQLVTYNDGVSDIVIKHCIACHRSGEIGAMPLTNYEEVRANAAMIDYVISNRLMPPWKADESYRHFRNENLLTQKEIDIFKSWLTSGMKEGKQKQNKILSKDAPHAMQWDMSIAMKESFEQYGIYYDQYQVFAIPYDIDSDKFVSAIQFVPGNRDIVRHATISIDTGMVADSLDRWDPRYGYFSFNGLQFTPTHYAWYDWSPNDTIAMDFNKILPKKGKLLLQIYYGPTGIPQKDSSYINLKFGHTPLRKKESICLIDETMITNPPFIINANEEKYFNAEVTLSSDMELLSIFPIANLLCKKMEVFAKSPDGKLIKLIRIKDWDFHWQRRYAFEQPIHLPKGTKIIALAAYDNTVANGSNPSNPPTVITKGQHMFKEQMKIYVERYFEE